MHFSGLLCKSNCLKRDHLESLRSFKGLSLGSSYKSFDAHYIVQNFECPCSQLQSTVCDASSGDAGEDEQLADGLFRLHHWGCRHFERQNSANMSSCIAFAQGSLQSQRITCTSSVKGDPPKCLQLSEASRTFLDMPVSYASSFVGYNGCRPP